MPTLRLALAQGNPTVGDLEGNAELAFQAVRTAAGAGAQLVALPEMFITGYPIEDLALRPSFQAASRATVQALAERLEREGLGDIAVVVGCLGENCQSQWSRWEAVVYIGRSLSW